MTHFPTLATNLASGTDQGSRPLSGRVGCFQHERNEVSDVMQLIALREVARMHVKQWQEKAKAEAMEALFNEEPTIRADAMNRCWMRQGRHMEADFWLKQIQSAIDGMLGPKSTTVEKSTIVDWHGDATAAAVVLGEDKRSGTWFGCSYCGSAYDQSEANARLRVCCGALLTVHQGNRKQ